MEVNSLDRHASSFDGWGLQYEAGETPFYILDLFKKQLEQNTYYYSLNNTHERNVALPLLLHTHTITDTPSTEHSDMRVPTGSEEQEARAGCLHGTSPASGLWIRKSGSMR